MRTVRPPRSALCARVLIALTKPTTRCAAVAAALCGVLQFPAVETPSASSPMSTAASRQKARAARVSHERMAPGKGQE